MKTETRRSRIFAARRILIVAFILTTLAALGCFGMMSHASRPAPEEFGHGPRASQQGGISATIESPKILAPRKLQSVIVRITDVAGEPVEGAVIEVDGGMPQHGHGLPTRPKVNRALGGGRYQIDGLRFNMGGWWQFHLTVKTPSGADQVTFNLDV